MILKGLETLFELVEIQNENVRTPPPPRKAAERRSGGQMEKVKISADGSSIDFVASESLPMSPKKFRESPELEGFYRFIYENDLRKEAAVIIDRIFLARKAKKLQKKA